MTQATQQDMGVSDERLREFTTPGSQTRGPTMQECIDMATELLAIRTATPAPEWQGMENELLAALAEIISAVRGYLPPDGIDKDALINRVIYAADNPIFNPAWKRVEAASALVWENGDARSPDGNLYSVVRLSENVWTTLKNGTAYPGWKPTQDEAKSVAVAPIKDTAK